MLFVKKKAKSLRLCIDYWQLNKVIVKNYYLLSRINDLFDQIKDAKVFSKINLQLGYQYFQIHEANMHQTTFHTHYGHYEFIVVPFGLTTAPSVFMSLMNGVFRTYLYRFILVFLDDISVYSRTVEEHEEHIGIVVSL